MNALDPQRWPRALRCVLARQVQRRTARRAWATIVTYHAVSDIPPPLPDWCVLDVATFRRQVRYLQRHFDVLPLSELAVRVAEGTLDRPTAAITLDDGFRNSHTQAYPILREAGLPATVFLTTGLVGRESTTWPGVLHAALARTQVPTLAWQDAVYDLRTPVARLATAAALRARLKRLPQPRLDATVRAIAADLGCDADAPVDLDSPYRMLDATDIAAMQAAGGIAFGAHTHTHTILSVLPEAQRHEQIARSVEAVARLTGAPCRLFAYPNGRAEDYTPDALHTLRACGVTTAVTAIPGPNPPGTPTLELQRYGVGPDLDFDAFQLRVHHAGPPLPA